MIIEDENNERLNISDELDDNEEVEINVDGYPGVRIWREDAEKIIDHLREVFGL